jgi:hypothetical protein
MNKFLSLFFILTLFISSCSSTEFISFNNEQLSKVSVKKNKILLKVIDIDTVEPLIGANIIITNNKAENTSTDVDGLAYISKGTIGNITVSYIGFNSVNFELNDVSIENILIRMKAMEFTGIVHYIFSKNRNDAKRDISMGIIQIYEDINDYTELIKNNLSKKYGFKYDYPDLNVMILDVDEYNQEVIKYLEKRNGSNWYDRFKSELATKIREKFNK